MGLQFTMRDVRGLIFFVLWAYMPGVDRKAVLQWTQSFFPSLWHYQVWIMQINMKIVEWGTIGFFYFLYWWQHPWVEKHKAFPHKPWPWNDPNPTVRAEYRALQIRSIKYILKFHGAGLLLHVFLARLDLPVDVAFTVDAVPDGWTSLWQMLVLAVCSETGFHWGHRLLHTKWFYRFHKKHHEFKETSVLATYHVHPFEAMLTSLMPSAIPALALKIHVFVLWQHTIINALSAVYDVWGMIGFNCPPFVVQQEEAHDIHHRISVANYGAYYAWDRVEGTYVNPQEWFKQVYQPARQQGKEAYDMLTLDDLKTSTGDAGAEPRKEDKQAIAAARKRQ